MLEGVLQHPQRARLSLYLAAFLGGSGLTLYFFYLQPPHSSTRSSTLSAPIATPTMHASTYTSSNTSSSSASRGRFSHTSEEVECATGGLRDTPVRLTYPTTDDTLPSPPAAAVREASWTAPSTETAWRHRSLAEGSFAQTWMLQDTVVEGEEDEGLEKNCNEGENGMPPIVNRGSSRKSHSGSNSSASCHLDSRVNAQPREEDDFDERAVYVDPTHPVSVESGEDDDAAVRRAGKEDDRKAQLVQPPLLSDEVPHPLEDKVSTSRTIAHDQMNEPQRMSRDALASVASSSSSSSASTTVINVPEEVQQRLNSTSPSSSPARRSHDETAAAVVYAERAEVAAKPSPSPVRRTTVLVSPALVDDSPDGNSWVSPDRMDDAFTNMYFASQEGSADGKMMTRRAVVADAVDDTAENSGGGNGASFFEDNNNEAAASADESGHETDAVPSAHHTATMPGSQYDTVKKTNASTSSAVDTTTATTTATTYDTLKGAAAAAVTSGPSQRSSSDEPEELPVPPHIAKTLSSSVLSSSQPHASPEDDVRSAHAPDSPHTRNTVQRLRLQLNQAERAAALQQALHDAAQAENADLQLQMEELLTIQAELERRSQLHEITLTEVKQKHAQERQTWEAKAQQYREEQAARQEGQQAELQEVVQAWKEKLATSQGETEDLRHELAATRSELLALMEEFMSVKEDLEGEVSLRAEVEGECGMLQSKLKDMTSAAAEARAKEEKQHVKTFELMRRRVRDAEERAALAELAFQSMCHQLRSAAEKASDYGRGSLEVSALSTSSQTQRKEESMRRGAGDEDSTNSGAAILQTPSRSRLDDDVVAALNADRLSAAVAAALAEYKDARTPHTSTTQSGVTTDENAANSVSLPESAAAIASLAATTSIPVDHTPTLSQDIQLSLKQHQHEVQSVLSRVMDSFSQIARETRASADGRAAAVERALSAELRHLRAQLIEQQERQSTRNSAVPVRASVAINTDQVNSWTARSLPPVSPETSAPPPVPSIAVSADGASISELQQQLAETQRALLLEQRHTALLQKDVEELHEARYTATQLAAVEETLRDLQQSVAQMVRDAVDDILQEQTDAHVQSSELRRINAEATSASAGHWRRLVAEDARSEGTTTTTRLKIGEEYGRTSETTSPRAFGESLNRSVVRSVQKAVLLAEAQVERVGEELLANVRSSDRVEADRAAHRSLPYITNAMPPTYASHGGQSSKHVSTGAAAAAAPVAPPQSEKQQRVYEDMQELLHRSHAETHRDAREDGERTPPQSRYSPSGSRWMAGIRPPPTSSPSHLATPPTSSAVAGARSAPAGTNVTPARPTASAPSPYVQAYLRTNSPIATTATTAATLAVPPMHHVASSSEHTASPSATALRLFEGMVSTTQELRNVVNLLDVIRNTEETCEERQRERLLQWEEKILCALTEVGRSVRATLSAVRPRTSALEEFSRQRRDRPAAAAAAAESIYRTPAREVADKNAFSCGEEERQPPQVRLADILAGKQGGPHSFSTAGASLSSGAVVYPGHH